MSEHYLKIIQNYIGKMPSLSTTVTKVMEVCDQPTVSPNDLNKIISLDPVLAANVLKLINSAYYALPNHISSLTRAIIILGLNTVKNLALSTAVIGQMKNSQQDSLSMDEFWHHSIAVGVTAKVIATELNIPSKQREEYFLAGLLHDLGKIPIAHCFSDEYAQCLTHVEKEKISLSEAESRVFGFNHQQCGYVIASNWQLPQSIMMVIKNHHQKKCTTDEHALLVSTVALANIYANVFSLGHAGDHYMDEDYVINTIEQSQLSWLQLTQLHELIQESIEKASIFLQIS